MSNFRSIISMSFSHKILSDLSRDSICHRATSLAFVCFVFT